MAVQTVIRNLAILDALLDEHRAQIGNDFPGYRNHCYRVLNFGTALGPLSPDATEKLAIAAAFHDIGIWTDGTFDYIAPSVRQAEAYLRDSSRREWTDEITSMIREHHKIVSIGDRSQALVESFRKADWIDVSMGVLTFGLSRSLIRDVQSAFPDEGFHRRLVQLSWRRFLRHPLSPLPMVKL